VLTSLSTLFITNNAAAAIMFPIAYSMSQALPLDLKPIMLILVLGASSCFASPIGYQTNLMVYAAGGYKYRDFFRLGFLMNILVGIVAVTLVYFLYVH
jgi:di/tricarboxylate transporter